MSGTKHPVTWEIVKTVTVGTCIVEISGSSQRPKRFSYRLTWTEGDKRGAWFPDRTISHVESIAQAVGEAELWILDERQKQIDEHEKMLTERKEKEADKRKRHAANVERRKDENRAHAARR